MRRRHRPFNKSIAFVTLPPAFPHQATYLREYGTSPHHGLFWDPGTGKTRSILDTAAALLKSGEAKATFVLAPNGVHRNWETDEIPVHWAQDKDVLTWSSAKATTKSFQADAERFLASPKGYPFLLMSYDALMTDLGARFARRFLDKRPTLFVADESQRIKTPGAKRTKRALAAAAYAPFRRAGTGTLLAQSPFDAYSQLKWLNPKAFDQIGCATFLAFKQTFGVFKKRTVYQGGRQIQFDELDHYKNLDLLNRIIRENGSIVEEPPGLPLRVYSKRYYTLPLRARQLYNTLKEEYYVDWEAGLLTAPLAISRYQRFQQITSGFLPTDDDKTLRQLDDTNPRVDLLIDTLDSLGSRPTIIWAKYDEDIDLIIARLAKENRACVRYDGRVSEAERVKAKQAFQDGSVPLFVSKASVGGVGLTLIQAKAEVFYNTTFKTDERIQAEKRAHRAGQTDSVLIIDLIAQDTLDSYILDTLRTGKSVIDTAMGRNPREWL